LIIFYFNVCTVLLPEFFIQYLADFYCWALRSLVAQLVCNFFH
jgi:hypothetical protein